MNNVSLVGRLVRDPELRYLPNGGQAVARMTLAVDREYSRQQKQDAEQAGRPTADFISMVAWGKTAEFCANYLEKGNRASVQGRITTGSYEGRDGKRVYTTDVTISNINPIDWKSSSGNMSSSFNQSNYDQRSQGYDRSQNNDGNQGNDFGGDLGFDDVVNDDDIPF